LPYTIGGDIVGREWIYLDELEFPSKCPKCGGRRFRVEGARKVFFEAVFEVTDESIKTVEDHNTDVDWEVAYSLECAECGEDLSDEVGF
jgi:DNA-directed RNA polymerase subunit RPC12/RpoP